MWPFDLTFKISDIVLLIYGSIVDNGIDFEFFLRKVEISIAKRLSDHSSSIQIEILAKNMLRAGLYMTFKQSLELIYTLTVRLPGKHFSGF